MTVADPTTPSPGTPATSDEPVSESVETLARSLWSQYIGPAEDRHRSPPASVYEQARLHLAAVRPLIEAEARTDERRKIAEEVRNLRGLAAFNFGGRHRIGGWDPTAAQIVAGIADDIAGEVL